MESLGAPPPNALLPLDTTEVQAHTIPTRTVLEMLCSSQQEIQKSNPRKERDIPTMLVLSRRTHHIPSLKTATNKPFVRRIATRSTSLLRTAKIPKWITFDTTETNSSRLPADQCENEANEAEKLMPLSDLAMVLSRNLDGAIAKGLFESDPKKLSKKRTDMDTISTSSSITLHSNFNSGIRQIRSTQCFKDLM